MDALVCFARVVKDFVRGLADVSGWRPGKTHGRRLETSLKCGAGAGELLDSLKWGVKT